MIVSKHYRNGFTLLELLIVVGIIGFVSTISIFSMRDWSNKKYLDKTVSGFINALKVLELRQYLQIRVISLHFLILIKVLN